MIITPKMVAAGEEVILACVGGADLGGYFSASELAVSVYKAMAKNTPGRTQSDGGHQAVTPQIK
jgi:hypothetical protein